MGESLQPHVGHAPATTCESSESEDFRIAVIGSGPKALYALESLVRRLRTASRNRARVRIEVIDDNPCFGAGAAYAVDQPDYLRLNVTSGIVDAHEPGAADRLVPTFANWSRTNAPQLDGEIFPPRSWIGRYLQDAWAAVEQAAPETVSFHRVSLSAVEVQKDPVVGRWRISTDDGAQRGPFHEVLVSTGHNADHAGALHHHWRSPAMLVPGVYPVQRWLSREHVPAGSRVAVRGGALTFIDACLALTQGRGGIFFPDPTGGLAYEPSGHEPAAILPVTRQGLLMNPKSAPETVATLDLDAVLQPYRERMAASGTAAQMVELVEAATVKLLESVSSATLIDPAWEISYTVRHGAELAPNHPNRAREVLDTAIAQAEGRADPGPAWALGQVWSRLYATMVHALSYRELDPDDWAHWRNMAARMERLAFGPPLLNAHKLRALLKAHIVDLQWMRGAVTVGPDGVMGLEHGDEEPDVVIDAVLAPPGVTDPGDRLFGSLARQGLVSIPEGRRGTRTTFSAQALDTHGKPVPGLSILGRPTEDHVIGHDSLNRALHCAPQRWADRVSHDMTGTKYTTTQAGAST